MDSIAVWHLLPPLGPRETRVRISSGTVSSTLYVVTSRGCVLYCRRVSLFERVVGRVFGWL